MILRLVLIFSLLASCVQAQMDQHYRKYIYQYAGLAMQEMRSTGVPASITLAQALLESAGGTSALAKKANNHFGIKCKTKQAKGYYKVDDDKDHRNKPVASCFMHYNSVAACYREHSAFLQRLPYQENRHLNMADFENWALVLQNGGYSSDPKYAEKLIGLIKEYALTTYDLEVLRHPESKDAPMIRADGFLVAGLNEHVEPQSENRIKSLYCIKKGDSLSKIAEKYQISLVRLCALNGLNVHATLKEGAWLVVSE